MILCDIGLYWLWCVFTTNGLDFFDSFLLWSEYSSSFKYQPFIWLATTNMEAAVNSAFPRIRDLFPCWLFLALLKIPIGKTHLCLHSVPIGYRPTQSYQLEECKSWTLSAWTAVRKWTNHGYVWLFVQPSNSSLTAVKTAVEFLTVFYHASICVKQLP